MKRHGLGVLASVHPVEADPNTTIEGNNNNTEKNNEQQMIEGAIDMVEWIYEGEWKEDMMHGRGVFRFPSGAVFDVCFLYLLFLIFFIVLFLVLLFICLLQIN